MDPGPVRSAKGYRRLANVFEEWAPLDTVDFGVPESENLHNAAGFFGSRYPDPGLDFGGEPVRIARPDGIAHWRGWTYEMGIELVCPEEAFGWPKRIEALISTYRVGDPSPPVPTEAAIRQGESQVSLGRVVIPDDRCWRLLSFDLPPDSFREPHLLFWLDDRANRPEADRHLGRHIAWVRLMGRVLPDTTWSAVARDPGSKER